MRGFNRSERQIRINSNINKLKGYKRDWNCVKFNPINSKEHEMKKAEVCFEASKKGFDFLTEVEFREGGRTDIYLPEIDFAIEILHTETNEMFLKKKYPVKRVMPIKTTDEIIL